MLESLYVKDFAIVGEAEIGFGPGLTVVTGETGAGKSLLVDALLLLGGARGDAGFVRHGSERAELSARFDVRARPDIRAWLAAEDLEDEDGWCQLRRVIRAEGSSRGWINGRPVTLAQMKTLAALLIEIHGQNEHQALLERPRQLALLDAFGGHVEALADIGRIARDWRLAGVRIDELSRGQDHAERIDWLAHQLDELDRHAIDPGALHELDAEHRRLANAGQLLQGCAGAAELIDGDGEISLRRLVARAQGEIGRLAALDERLAPVRDLLDNAEIQIGEADAALSRYQSILDLDPERLAEIEDQLAKLHELARKHRVPMAELKAFAGTLRDELEELRGAGASIARLEAERSRLLAAYAGAAKALGGGRAVAADKLGREVTALMAELGMAGGRFAVELEAREPAEPAEHGAERCEFLVSANPDQPPRALRKVASGGELSRISLAIEVAALGLDTAGTMVFDEVDAGIGGAVAEVVGQKLRRLGSERQVLCVTHLAQVAAQGHRHLRVSKSSDTGTTDIRIEALGESRRRDEIARMLGGIDITRETRAHAKQMLDSAQKS
ncbi:MAG TPA: DNA repair protein RecN [Rhodanobacteraceae bacterium]|nr:DNA repair protein RecN [Rhodanobacteraceae bacterium]